MTMNNPRRIRIKVPGDDDVINMTIPEDLWKQIPEQRRQTIQDLTDYLLDSLRIGILATVNASITIDTKKMEEVVDGGIKDMENQKKELNRLFNEKLIGEKSDLSVQLKNTLGEDGSLANLLKNLKSNLTNPELAGSIPAATKNELFLAANKVKDDLNRALDITDESTSLGKLIKNQDNRLKEIERYFTEQYTELKTALRVDETLQKQAEENKELKDKSSHKGTWFENDTLEALKQIAAASKWNDEITHTGGNVVKGSLVKAGDILIKIGSPGNLTIALEAKSGGIGMAEISREAKKGREARTADAGIGVMTRKARGVTQSMLSNVNAGMDTIAVVDWAAGEENDDLSAWVALEVAYVTIRAKLIAEHLSATTTIDADAINKQVDQVITDLKGFSDLKTKTTNAKTSVQAIEDVVMVLEEKIKISLSALKGLTKE